MKSEGELTAEDYNKLNEEIAIEDYIDKNEEG